MEISQFQTQQRNQETFFFPLIEEKNNRKEYFKIYHANNKIKRNLAKRIKYKSLKLGLNFEVVDGVFGGEPQPRKTRKEINRTYYLKNKERYLDTSRKQYLFKQFYKFSSTILNKGSPPTQETRETTENTGLNNFRPQYLNKLCLYRRAGYKANNQYQEKGTCFCWSDRSNKALLLFCALNSKEKRASTSNKAFNLFGVNMVSYLEMREWEELKKENGEVSIRGGHLVGNYRQTTADFDFRVKEQWADKPWHFKHIEPWRTKAIKKNFELLIDFLKVCPRDTKHGGHIDLNHCCEWPNLTFYHIDKWKQIKKNIGDTRGKRKYAVVDDKDKTFRSIKGHKLSWRLKCQQLSAEAGEEVGRVKTCLEQFIEILAKFNFVAEISSKTEAKKSVGNKVYESVKKGTIYTADIQISNIKLLADKCKTSNWEPYAIYYNEGRRYFVLNANQKRQSRALQQFRAEPSQRVKLYQGNYQTLFYGLC